MDMSKTLSDLPMDLHRLILSHDEEKLELKKENEKLKTRVKMLQSLLDEARQDNDSEGDDSDEENSDSDEDEDEDELDNWGHYECGCYYKAAAGGFCGTRFVDKYGCTTESRILYSGEWESDCDEHYQSEEHYVCINCADEWKEALGMYEDGDEQYYEANAPQDLTACEMNKAWQSAHNTKRNMPVGDVIHEFLCFLYEIPQEKRCVSKNLHEWQRKRTLMKLAFKQWVKKEE